jgi:hypothetical protein
MKQQIRRAVQKLNPSMTPSKPPQSPETKIKEFKAKAGGRVRRFFGIGYKLDQ